MAAGIGRGNATGAALALQRLAGNAAVGTLLEVQRDPPGLATPSAPRGPAGTPPGGPTVITFEGLPLSSDPTFTRRQLERRIVAVGQRGMEDFVRRFEAWMRNQRSSTSAVAGAATDASADPTVDDTWNLEDSVLQVVRAQSDALRSEHGAFLGRFVARAEQSARALLDDSSARIRAELVRYGIRERRTTEHLATSATARTGLLEERTSRQYTMGANAENRGLAAAARELVPLIRRVEQLRQQRLALNRTSRDVRHGEEYEICTDPAQAAVLDVQLRRADRAYQLRRAHREAQFPALAPILRSPGTIANLEGIASGPAGSAGPVVGGQLGELLANIDRVRAAIGGDFRVLQERRVVDITRQQLGVAAHSREDRWAADAVAADRSSHDAVGLGVGLFALVLGVLAAIPTGGASVGLAAASAVAGAGASAASAYLAVDHLRRYQLQAAASGTDLDRARAISHDEPSFLWLALDIVGAVADLGVATAAFARLRAAIARLRVTRDIAALRRAAIDVLPPEQAEQLVARAAEHEGVSVGPPATDPAAARVAGAAAVTIPEARSRAFVLMAAELLDTSSPRSRGMIQILLRMHESNRIRPLTLEAMAAAEGRDVALIRQELLREGKLGQDGRFTVNALYSNGTMYLDPSAPPDRVIAALVHENTHAVQATWAMELAHEIPGVNPYSHLEDEVQAHAVLREQLVRRADAAEQGLPATASVERRAQARIRAVPTGYDWMVNPDLTFDAFVDLIRTSYRLPGDAVRWTSFSSTVDEALERAAAVSERQLIPPVVRLP